MKLTILIPDEMKQRLDSYIAKRFGNQKPRAVSLVIREALNDFLSMTIYFLIAWSLGSLFFG